MTDLLTLDHVRAAHERIRDAIVATPTLYSQTLSKLTGANIYLKFENLQFTAAFKEAYGELPTEYRRRHVCGAKKQACGTCTCSTCMRR